MNKTKANKVICITLLIMIFINLIPIKSLAHDAYFFQVLIDENTMTYMGNIVVDRASKWSHEKKHIEAGLWEADSFANSSKNGTISNPTGYATYSDSSNGTSSMAFTFPSKEIRKPTNHVTSKDIDRAYEIRDTLVPNLNEILTIMNNGKKYETLDELISASEVVMRGGTYSNNHGDSWNISYSGNDVVISNGSKSYTYLAKMVKGYNLSTLEDGRKSPVYNSALDYSDDVEYISIGMIAFQANYAYEVKEHLAEHAGEYTKPGVLEQKLSELLSSAINGVRSLLGLYNLNELIYNQGVRDTRGFYGGVMSYEWMEKTTYFHMIFQGLAWLALALAILKILVQRNLATVYMNPAVKLTLMDSLRDMLLTGFMLISSFVLLNTVLRLNEKIVAIFGTTIPDYAGFTGISNDYQTFAGSLLQIYYLVITVYMNFVYIVRGITIAVLIASAPFFIASIAFEGKSKRLFTTWIKELMANIFLQSFHAFVLSLLLNIQMSTRGIELAIISFALIPLTNMFKGLIVGESGGMAGQLVSKSASMGISAASGFIGGAIANRRDDGSTGNNSGNSGNSGGHSGTNSSNDIKTKDSSNIPGARENPERRNHSTEIPNKRDTEKAFNAMESDFNSEGTREAEATNYEKLSTNLNKKGDISKSDVVDTAKNIGGTAFTAAKGLGKVAVGASVAMALGGESREAANLISSGMNDLGSSGKRAISGTASGAIGGTKRAIDYFRDSEKNGNILGAERMDNGDVVVNRNRSMLKKDGLNDVVKTSEGNVAMTYNKENLSEDNQKRLEKIEDSYRDGKFDYLRDRGIERVSKNGAGETVVHYNQHGQNNLGFKDMYQTGNRIVETKSAGQPLHTNLLYDIDETKPTPPNAFDNSNSRRGKFTIDLDGRV